MCISECTEYMQIVCALCTECVLSVRGACSLYGVCALCTEYVLSVRSTPRGVCTAYREYIQRAYTESTYKEYIQRVRARRLTYAHVHVHSARRTPQLPRT